MHQSSKSRNRLPLWFQHLLAALGFLLLIGILYAPVLTGHASLKTNFNWPPGPLFVQDPTAGGATTLPYEQLVSIAWRHLWLPAWDPYQAFGIPLWATQGNAFFVPEVLLHLLLPHNYSLWNLLRLILMAYGAYLLARSLGQHPIPSFVAGVVYSLSGPTPTNVNVGPLNPLVIFPLLLLALRYLLDPRSRRLPAFLGVITTVAMLAISGFAEVLPLLLIVVLIYMAAMIAHFRHATGTLRRAGLSLLAGALGAIIGGIGLLPVLSATLQGMANNTNSALSYLSSVQRFWLATAFIPRVSGAPMVLFAKTFAQTVWTLGTPFLGLAIVLALLGAILHDRHALWYVLPSAAMSVFGILGYANVGGVLGIFGIFPFDHIIMVRFLEFAWWLPWSLLVGFVLSVARKFRLVDLALGLGISALVDVLLAHVFSTAMSQLHATSVAQGVRPALEMSLLAMALLVVALGSARVVRTSLLAGIVVVALTIAFLPRNFFPPTGNQIGRQITGPHLENDRMLLLQQGLLQLPTTTNSAQIEGPINPPAYLSIIDELVPPSQVTFGGEASNDTGQPTLFYVKLEASTLASFRQLGVNRLATTTPIALPDTPTIPSCQAQSSYPRPALCLLAEGALQGVAPRQTLYLYKLPGVDPLVAAAKAMIPVRTNHTALDRIARMLGNGGSLTHALFVTTKSRQVRAAARPRGIARITNTEGVTVELTARSRGLVVLRDTYLPGMSCSVNGASVPCFPADGGMWTAVPVPAGRSRAHLDYVVPIDRWSALISLGGLGMLLLGWLGLLGGELYRRSQPGAGNRFKATDHRGGRAASLEEVVP